MTFFTGWAGKVGEKLVGLIPHLTGVLLSKSDGSADLWQSDDNGAAKVALPPGAATSDAQTNGTQIANVRSALGTWTPATAAAAADSGVIKNSACKVGKVQAVNSHATIAYYLMLFDLAAVPANGTAPRYPAIPLVPGQAVMLPYGGATHANGLCWAASTTVATLTVSATTPFQVSAEVL